MNILKRRRLGLTLAVLVPIAARLKKTGQLDECNHDEIAVLIMQEWVKDVSTDTKSQLLATDWDAILEFIRALIPLIMQLIDLFN